MFKTLFSRPTKLSSTKASSVGSSHTRSIAKSCLPKTEVQQTVLKKIEADYQQAEAILGRQFPRPIVQFTLRGKSAGTAHLQLNKLRFNPVLLEENSTEFIEQVVPHEISHLLSYQLFGRVKPHGVEWQRIMHQVYNVPAHTTHQLNTQSVAGKQFEYYCACGPVQLSIKRHNKVLRNQTQYRCKNCSQVLAAKA
ncbi:SprT family zinc-dependent metalloprotease [Shewanella sp. 10N.7]|uniref:SprT family zinc-dependent metalloprotease n=1 Tax=Shewanella sp. 10N.7 TaxID=2885093 RepID=UPI001E3BA838|nr:SprT family zinc-dependent metalloprotease [Shewanella sp. 10N.7]MCC4831654.1 SprT family zinc-dependent metalloprotease [Shewanella sp. 10N.7]